MAKKRTKRRSAMGPDYQWLSDRAERFKNVWGKPESEEENLGSGMYEDSGALGNIWGLTGGGYGGGGTGGGMSYKGRTAAAARGKNRAAQAKSNREVLKAIKKAGTYKGGAKFMYGKPAVPVTPTGDGSGTSISYAQQLKDFQFTDPSIVDRWANEANSGGKAQAGIDQRVAGLADLGRQLGVGAERIKTKDAELTGRQAAADKDLMALAASYAPKVEEETPAVRAAAAGQATAQNTTMGTRASGNSAVMNEISQVHGQMAQDSQSAIASGQNQARSSLGYETEVQKRLDREAAMQRYQVVRASEQDKYNKIAQLAQLDQDKLEILLKAAGGGDSASRTRAAKNKELEYKLRGQTGEAGNAFATFLDALESTGGDVEAAANLPGVKEPQLSSDEAVNLYNIVQNAYSSSAGSGTAVSRALRDYYRQQGYGNAAKMRPWMDEFYTRAPLKKKRKRPTK